VTLIFASWSTEFELKVSSRRRRPPLPLLLGDLLLDLVLVAAVDEVPELCGPLLQGPALGGLATPGLGRALEERLAREARRTTRCPGITAAIVVALEYGLRPQN